MAELGLWPIRKLNNQPMDEIFKHLNDCIYLSEIAENTLVKNKLTKVRDLLIRKIEIEYEQFDGQL